MNSVPAIVITRQSIDELAVLANKEHNLACAASQTALTHAINCGAYLLGMKKMSPHGDFSNAQRAAHLTFGARTVQQYIRLAEHKTWIDMDVNRPQSIRGALEYISGLETIRAHWPKPGQRVLAFFGDDGIAGLLGSLTSPGWAYFAVSDDSEIKSSKRYERCDAYGLKRVARLFLRSDRDSLGVDSLRDLEWAEPDDAGLFDENWHHEETGEKCTVCTEGDHRLYVCDHYSFLVRDTFILGYGEQPERLPQRSAG
jgi:hypothetical protein